MYALGILLLFFVGYLTVFNISTLTTRLERIGLAFPVGVGVMTIVMALIDLCRIPLTANVLLTADVVVALLLVGGLLPRKQKVIEALRRPIDLNSFNFIWLLLLAFAVWVEYANFQKCMFFPTYDRDSLAAFDTLGFVAAKEHTYGGMSIFTGDYMPGIHAPGSPIAYLPLVQLAYAYVYALGAESSKIIPGLIYLSFLVAFYAVLARVTSRTAAMAATLFVVLTPEMTSFSSLSGTNVMDAVYASLGIIYVLCWMQGKEKPWLTLGALLLALNVWCRAEGVVFILVAGVLVLYKALRTRAWKPLIPVALAFLPVIIWQIYSHSFNMTVQSFVITRPYFDGVKAGKVFNGAWALLANTQYYGWTFIALLLAIILDAWFMIKHRSCDIAKLFAIAAGIALYFLVLYQVDYRWDSIDNVLSWSAKRFMFCFVPMAWYFVATCEPINKAMTKADAWLAK